MTLRSSAPTWNHMAAVATLTTSFIITWQFAQFMLFTQVPQLYLYIITKAS
jgi:hypothetical protein